MTLGIIDGKEGIEPPRHRTIVIENTVLINFGLV
jgi:hypothetical protein